VASFHTLSPCYSVSYRTFNYPLFLHWSDFLGCFFFPYLRKFSLSCDVSDMTEPFLLETSTPEVGLLGLAFPLKKNTPLCSLYEAAVRSAHSLRRRISRRAIGILAPSFSFFFPKRTPSSCRLRSPFVRVRPHLFCR